VAVGTRRRTPGWAAARQRRRESLRRGSWLKGPRQAGQRTTCSRSAHVRSSQGLVCRSCSMWLLLAAQDHPDRRARSGSRRVDTPAKLTFIARARTIRSIVARGSGPCPTNPVVKRPRTAERPWRGAVGKAAPPPLHGAGCRARGRGVEADAVVVTHHALLEGQDSCCCAGLSRESGVRAVLHRAGGLIGASDHA